MAIPQSKNQYEPRYINHFEALEQTCRLRQLSGSGDKYFFQVVEVIEATVLNLVPWYVYSYMYTFVQY